jgi:lipoate-protein ligase A
MNSLRLIVDSPASGPWNMAIDEVLLESAADFNIATLRLYSWAEPTLSLGYFQAAADRQSHSPSQNCPLIRRASGGGAILHDRELTYSLALPEKSARADTARLLYDACHATLIALLVELGVPAQLHSQASQCATEPEPNSPEPFLCFQRRTCFDIVLPLHKSTPAKVVGSAQRRRRGGILQHGSILLAQSPFAPELPGIQELSGQTVTSAHLTSHWPPLLNGLLKAKILPGELTPAEFRRAELLSQERFAATDYIYRR